MDKPERRKTITIRLNEQKETAEDMNRIKDEKKEEAFFQYERKRAVNEYPINEKEAETEKINTNLNETEMKEERDGEEAFNWVLPETRINENGTVQKVSTLPKYGKKRESQKADRKKGIIRKGKAVFSPALLTVVLAIIVGISLGMIMLNLVRTDSKTEKESIAAMNNEGKGESEKNISSDERFKTEVITGYVVQVGIFSSEEGAKQQIKSVFGKGVPATLVPMDGKTFVFVGIADSLEHAKALGNLIEKKNISVYAKKAQFGGSTRAEMKEVEANLLKKAVPLFEMIAKASTNASLSKGVSDETMAAITQQMEEWKKLDTKKVENDKILELQQELNEAVENLVNYKKSQDEQLLGDIQQRLLNFIKVYHTM